MLSEIIAMNELAIGYSSEGRVLGSIQSLRILLLNQLILNRAKNNVQKKAARRLLFLMISVISSWLLQPAGH